MSNPFHSMVMIIVMVASPAMASQQEGAPVPKKPCSSELHRAFDFWIGEWRVTTPTRPNWEATSSITVGNAGCSIHEAYKTVGGYQGTSVNFYDATKNRWHQTWIDNQGNPLYLEGGLDGTKMVLSDGANNITWSLLEDGRVRQLWQTVEGETLKTLFDGYYERID